MRTRTKKTQKASDLEGTSSGKGTASTMPDSDAKPPTLTILPKDLSPEARILQLPSMAEQESPKQVLICPLRGFFEFTSIEETVTTRSWLITPDTSTDHEEAGKDDAEDNGYVLKRPEMLVASPLDPLFIVLPLILKATEAEGSSYLACSDYVFGQEDGSYAEFKLLMRSLSFSNQLKHIEARIANISEKLDLGDDQDAMYQFSSTKLYEVILAKAEKLAANGLPASMEDKFVRQALQKPIIFTKADEAELQQQELEQQNEAPESEGETAAKSGSDEVDDITLRLQRVKVAFDYIIRAYLPQSLHATLKNKLVDGNSPDFKPLLKLEEEIRQLKQQTQALRTMSENISRKRAIDDEEAVVKAEDKRRKKEEEEKKKKNVSNGIKQLAKADTSGMKKLSSFFTKKPVK